MNYHKLIIDDGTELNAGTIYCIGQNYARHASEMGSSVPEVPTVFIKPPAAYIPDGANIILPTFSTNVHHEVELVVLIGKDCHIIDIDKASEYIAGYAVGIDVTLRDLQSAAKNDGKPWAVAKGFYTSAPVSEFVSATKFNGIIPDFSLELSVNNQLRQQDSSAEMERSISQLIKYLAEVFTLRRGDMIFTGTPSGVGKIEHNDKITAELKGYKKLSVGVTRC